MVERAGGVLALEDVASELQKHFDCGAVPAANIGRLLFQLSDQLERVNSDNLTSCLGAHPPREGPIYARKECAEGFRPVLNAARRFWVGRDSAIRSDDWLQQVITMLEGSPETVKPSSFWPVCAPTHALTQPTSSRLRRGLLWKKPWLKRLKSTARRCISRF
jgi:hypothetical protein